MWLSWEDIYFKEWEVDGWEYLPLVCPWNVWRKWIYYNSSTAVVQAVACSSVTQRAQVRSRSGQVSWVSFFGVFRHLYDKYQEAFGPQGPRISFDSHNHPFILFTLLEWMGAWMICIVFHVRVVSKVAPALSWSLIRGGRPYLCVVKKYVCDELIPSPDRSWLYKVRVAWVT